MNMEHMHLTCINCPIGCYLTVQLANGEAAEISGNQCIRGIAYAKMESANPTRMVCSSVPVTGGPVAQAPVKTRSPIPKRLILDCVKSLAGVSLAAPVRLGQVVVKDVCGTGVDIIATRSIPVEGK